MVILIGILITIPITTYAICKSELKIESKIEISSYTGYIYRNDRFLKGTSTIGQTIVPVNGKAWCLVQKNSLYTPIDSCNYNEKNECMNDINDMIDSGEIREGNATCEYKTVPNIYFQYTTDLNSLIGFGYIKHKVVNNIITESYICKIFPVEHYCIRGGIDESNLTYKPIYEANKDVINQLKDSDRMQDYHDPVLTVTDDTYKLNFKDYCTKSYTYNYIYAKTNGEIGSAAVNQSDGIFKIDSNGVTTIDYGWVC